MTFIQHFSTYNILPGYLQHPSCSLVSTRRLPRIMLRLGWDMPPITSSRCMCCRFASCLSASCVTVWNSLTIPWPVLADVRATRGADKSLAILSASCMTRCATSASRLLPLTPLPGLLLLLLVLLLLLLLPCPFLFERATEEDEEEEEERVGSSTSHFDATITISRSSSACRCSSLTHPRSVSSDFISSHWNTHIPMEHPRKY